VRHLKRYLKDFVILAAIVLLMPVLIVLFPVVLVVLAIRRCTSHTRGYRDGPEPAASLT
jgi:hypothetical protein